MTANSGGGSSGGSDGGKVVDWSSIIKPFVIYSVGSISRKEVNTLIKAIIDSEEDLVQTVDPANQYSVFYDVVTLLSSHVLTSAAKGELLSRSIYPLACKAAKILCESYIKRFNNVVKSKHPIIKGETYVLVLKEFCTGEVKLKLEEVVNILALLKNQDMPTKIQSTAPSTWDKEGTTSNTSKEVRRNRLDPSILLSDQMSIPVMSIPNDEPIYVLFAQEVVQNFLTLRGGQVLVKECLKLPFLSGLCPENVNLDVNSLNHFYKKFTSEKNTATLDLKTISEELDLLYQLSLTSIFSSFNSDDAKIINLVGNTLGNLAFLIIHHVYKASSTSNINQGQGTSSSAMAQQQQAIIGNDTRLEFEILSKALYVQNRLIDILKDNIGLSHSTHLNFCLCQSRIILLNLQSFMNFVSLNESKGHGEKDKSSKQQQQVRINLIAVQQIWNEFLALVSSHLIDLVKKYIRQIFENDEIKIKNEALKDFRIDSNLKNLERIAIFFHDCNCFELFIQLTSFNYRKACRLKLIKYCNQQEKEKVNDRIDQEKSKTLNIQSDEAVVDNIQSSSNTIDRLSIGGGSNLADSNDENDHENIDVEVEDDNHSVSDLMTTEDEEDPDDDDDDDDEDNETQDVPKNKADESSELDEEPILGKWFLEEETEEKQLEAIKNDQKESNSSNNSDKLRKSDDDLLMGKQFIESDNPNGFIEASQIILNFITRDFVSNNNKIVQDEVKKDLNEQIVTLLAVIIKDLDMLKSSTEIGAISTIFDDKLNRIFIEFSNEIGKLIQIMIAQNLLSQSLLGLLLDQLGVDLYGSGRWNLGLYPRTLAIIVQVLLLKPDKENIIVGILKRVLETLVEDCSTSEQPPSTYSDLPVEHSQTIVFLFHTLSLMQKKVIMLETSSALINARNCLKGQIKYQHQIMSLSRLLLFFDYFIRQLYEPGLNLIHQIQYNLFNEEQSGTNTPSASSSQNSRNLKNEKTSANISRQSTSLCQNNIISSSILSSSAAGAGEPPHSQPLPPSRIFFDCATVEKKIKGDKNSTLKPQYYNLIGVEPNFQENPRLDGLAMNFLLNKNDVNHKDKKEYVEVIDAILSLFEICLPRKSEEPDDIFAPYSSYYIEYFLTRLFYCLPPSIEFLQRIENIGENKEFFERPSTVLYLIIWLPRIQNRVFVSWIKDCFTKQGISMEKAEELSNQVDGSKLISPFLESTAKWIAQGKLGKNNASIYFYATEASISYASYSLTDEESITNNCLSVILDETLGSLRSVITETVKNKGSAESLRSRELSAFHLMSFSSNYLMNNSIAKIVLKNIDPDLKISLDKHCQNEDFMEHFPEFSDAKYKNDNISSESYLLAVLTGHMKGFKSKFITSLMHVLGSIVNLIGKQKNASTLLFPLLLDKTTEYLGEIVGAKIDSNLYTKVDCPLNGKLVDIIGRKSFSAICYPELRVVIQEKNQDLFQEELLNGLKNILNLKESEFTTIFMKMLIDDSGLFLMKLVDLIMETSNEGVLVKSCEFLSQIFTSTLPTTTEDIKKLSEILFLNCERLESLPDRVFSSKFFNKDRVIEACCKFFSSLLMLFAKNNEDKNNAKIIPKFLSSTISVMKNNLMIDSSKKTVEESTWNWNSFNYVLRILIQMASTAEAEEGHLKLFKQMTEWLNEFSENINYNDELISKNNGDDVSSNSTTTTPVIGTIIDEAQLNSLVIIMEYISEVGKSLQSLSNISGQNNTIFSRLSALDRETTPGTPPNDEETNFDLESEIGDDTVGQDDEDSVGDDSDDEGGLNNKLCTYTITQKEFIAQHWYHCHNCNVDGVGICSVCARVCHKTHDVTYAKYGNFFCDCGAGANGPCSALTRRQNSSSEQGQSSSSTNQTQQQQNPPGNNYNPFLSNNEQSGGNNINNGGGNNEEIMRRGSSPTILDYKSIASAGILVNQFNQDINADGGNLKQQIIEKALLCEYEALIESWKNQNMLRLPLTTITKLLPVIKRLVKNKSSVGANIRVQDALNNLRNNKNCELEFTSSEDLVFPTLGSQEGAFENIKMQYNGEQGSTIRQLINSNVIRRSTISAFSSPAFRRNYLAVCQEKGKVTVLQLGVLLSGAETGKKKLTLPRLTSLTLPFTALTMATNPLRDDVLAVCGLKDCHVLVIGTGGSISTHIVVQTQIESQNHIIKPLWITGSQTELAIITSEGVKIYDLSKDVNSPIYHFLLPAGKVRDATFIIQDDNKFIAIMAHDGKIYHEKLDDTTSAANGPYYIVNDLNYQDAEMVGSESSASDSKGVSLYYSHSLKLLFYTYNNGKSYVATLENLITNPSPLTKAVLITPKSNGSPSALRLTQWTEVLGHPGLIFAMGQGSIPYVLLLTENGSFIQEIKTPGKVKPMDMIAIRHLAPGKMKTSLLILCDDGSLRVCDSTDSTEFWLNPRLRPFQDPLLLKSAGKKNSLKKILNKQPKSSNGQGQISFPNDFFEHCQPVDVEFGGNDLLYVYNVAQLKTRLNNSGMYIVSTKAIGFNLEVTNSDGSMVICAIRVFLGSQSLEKVPSFIQVFGRTLTVNLTRPRFFDIPLTREESLMADQKLTITFGPSAQVDGSGQCTTFVDSVKIYGKTKDSFAWPEDEEIPATPATQSTQAPSQSSSNALAEKKNEDLVLEKIVTNSMELCELSVAMQSKDAVDLEKTLNIVTEIYLENYQPFNSPSKSLMLTILQNRSSFYEHRDQAVYSKCIENIMKMNNCKVKDIDPELFHHIVLCVKNIAVSRPQHVSHFEYKSSDYGQISIVIVINALCDIFKKLIDAKPKNIYLVSVDQIGIQRVDQAAMCLADIIYSVMNFDISLVSSLAPFLIGLLLSSNNQINVPVRTILVKRLRPKNSRKRKIQCPSPIEIESPREREPQSIGGASSLRNDPIPNLPIVEVDENIVMLGHDNDHDGPIQMLNPLEAFMGQEGFQGMDLQTEDEAMVELGIFLSLQEQAGGELALHGIQGLQEGLQALGALDEIHQEGLNANDDPPPNNDDDEQIEHGNIDASSDTASPPAYSDDEIATEGTMRGTSEPGGSDSSSCNEGTARRSSLNPRSNESSSQQNETKNTTSSQPDREINKDKALLSNLIQANAKPFRLALLTAISDEISNCTQSSSGDFTSLSIIPLLQVILVILAELDGSTEEELSVVKNMVVQLAREVKIKDLNIKSEWKRSKDNEMTLIVLRMLSILVSRWKADAKFSRSSSEQKENSWIAKITAQTIQEKQFGIVKFCKETLQFLRSIWKTHGESSDSLTVSLSLPAIPSNAIPEASLLKQVSSFNPPDYSPFFLKQYVKTHSSDVLEELPLLISEMALRLPYQVRKVLPNENLFEGDWEDLLCEMLQNRNAPFVRRQARKLLMNVAGSRENYHLLRDLYNIKYHLNEFKKLIGYEGNSLSEKFAKASKMEFKYSQLVSMVESLNSCIDIASARAKSWQNYCKSDDALQFIIQMSCTADESLTTAILTLIKIAIDGNPFDSKTESQMHKMSEDEKAVKSLAHQVIDLIEKRTFLEFIKKYLLEHPVLNTRWQAHSLVLGLFLTSDSKHQLKLITLLWDLWDFVPSAGSRAAQFIDILGYATLNSELKSNDLGKHINLCIESIENQGKSLLAHSNANIYSSLVPFVNVDGFYLESEPCEICYAVDKSGYSTQKLNSIKSDAKFGANSQIVKLTSTLSIIRLSIRLTEVKKARMIKTLIVYYSPKNLPIVELKNKQNLWQKARKVTLSPSQTEIKLDFSVPIVASNIMLEFLEFYENAATTETLTCPRCSASVPAQPGVCANCGENVYQCHKCRAINYDERDPFLCHSCGFCKYAKLDINLLAKNVVAVDPLENEEDHKKALGAVSSLLEKADQTYKQQQQIKAVLETMLQSIKEKRSMAGLGNIQTTISTTAQLHQPQQPAPPQPQQVSATYAQVAHAAAAANALGMGNNNGLLIPSGAIGNNGGVVINTAGTSSSTTPTTTAAPAGTSSSLVLKNVQSLAYAYAIDCKNSYEELNRLMSKVGAYRKEMLKIDPSYHFLDTIDNVTTRKCYGCKSMSITLSLKLLQALITSGQPRDPFDLSFLSFLLRLSHSAGSTQLKDQVKNALCFFVKDDVQATKQLTDIINSRVLNALSKESWSDISFEVMETSEEISLLASLLQMYDSCWEIKLKSLMKIFTYAINSNAIDSGLLPCLKIIQNFIRATQSGDQDKISVKPIVEGVNVNLQAWLADDENYSFENWKKRLPRATINTNTTQVQSQPAEAIKSKSKTATTTTSKESTTPTTAKTPKEKEKSGKDNKKAAIEKISNKEEIIKNNLVKKYGRIWVEKFFKIDTKSELKLDKDLIWIKKLLFNSGSVQTRIVTASLLRDLTQIPSRKLKIMEMLTCFMDNISVFDESCREFMELYRDLANSPEFSAFINVKGGLNIVCRLLDEQIELLHRLEAITLHSDLSQGIAIWELSKLLSTLAIPSVRRNKRISLLSTVLGGYLSLKRLRLHRTRAIEEAQEILLQLLEEITKGTEDETKIFMSVCVETLKKCPKEDVQTPVFVFERLCSLIIHEESDIAEFFVTLDKDPQQEDFLQGRMLGNPYSSNENGIGPLMRDIKNKICTDCELVALLEDDNGMELLVNNKIVSLDLPVKEVYRRLWLTSNGQIEPMKIIYRMRGLLGDAVEEFLESFASPTDSQEDNETTYKMANILVYCDGLQVIMNTLDNMLNQTIVISRVKPLIAVILKLLGYVSKIQAGRLSLVNPSLDTVRSLFPLLQLCLENDLTVQGSSGVVHLTDQVLELLDICLNVSSMSEEAGLENISKSRGTLEDIKKLLDLSDKLKGKPQTLAIHLKVLACLTYGDKDKMELIFNSFKDCWDFFKFDDDPNPEMSNKMEQICTLVSNLEPGAKDFALKEKKLLDICLDYLKRRAPVVKPGVKAARPDSDEWKDMISKPALKYVLRLLAGFANGHPPSQEVISDSILIIHQLEQVSSDEHVGSLAENALEALRSHELIWKKVQAARRETREEKKRMAMAMRQKQLNTMGMKTNEKGQVTARGSTILDQMEDLQEETGLVCVICREGYKYQPAKVIGIYTYSKRCLLEEHETKNRKTYGYCTVTHFNVVHIECHQSAIRLARSRDEWESASLQNANTRCNGLIPLWGQNVSESSFAACLARQEIHIREATGHRDVGFSSGAHDIKLLLIRFAEEKSFHEDTGGGGPESNSNLIPYLIHTSLYVLNTTRATSKESGAVDKFLYSPQNSWKDDACVVDGTYYHLVVGLMTHSPDKWKENKLQWLKRVLVMMGVRSKLYASTPFEQLRSGLIFLCLINGLYTIVFKDVNPSTGEWSSLVADYIRKNDESLLKSTSQLLVAYQQKLIPAKSAPELLQVLGMHEMSELEDFNQFLTQLFSEMV